MYIPIILGVIAAIFAIIAFFRERTDESPWMVLFAITIGLVAAMLASVVLTLVIGWLPVFDTGRVTNSYSLSAISDGQSTSGSFFLGSGFVDTHPSFSYYINQDGVIRLYSAKAEDSEIRYSNGAPVVEITKSYCPKESWLPSWECMGTQYVHYTFLIPNGSVRPTYSLPSK